MHLFPNVEKRYSHEQLSALEAQRMAQFIAWSPVVFQVSRLLLKWDVLALVRESREGLTLEALMEATGLSRYALTILTDAALSIGLLLIDPATDRFRLSKTGWFLLTDEGTRANLAFNHDVNYRGLFHLEEALQEGRPAGLKTLGDWSTIYEGLSQLPPEVQQSWFGFDHFYSDHSFDEALPIVFSTRPHRLMDVGGNTGRFALRCVAHDPQVEVTIVDLPGQIDMMRRNVADHSGADRIHAHATNLLAPDATLPEGQTWDVIWMSQFLDCFSEAEICAILTRTAAVMTPATHLYIMETFWDRQRFETASFCLTMTSVYFTAMANGNSKMYHSDRMVAQIEKAGLQVARTYDHLGPGHSILEVVKP